MLVVLTSESEPFYFAFDRIFIITDHPKAPEKMRDCPHIPAVNRKALELIEELIRSRADTEGKLYLLKQVVLAIDPGSHAVLADANDGLSCPHAVGEKGPKGLLGDDLP